MVVPRPTLKWYERLYLPALYAGLRVTLGHLFSWRKSGVYGDKTRDQQFKATLNYPEELWTVPPGYRGAPYLVSDSKGNTKCVSCQLCEFVCPPKAIRIVPPGLDGPPADRPPAEKMPAEFEIDMLRCIFCGYCEEVCPEEAIFLAKDYYAGYDPKLMRRDYALTATRRGDLVFNMRELLERGGTHADGHGKWEHKQREADDQQTFPLKG